MLELYLKLRIAAVVLGIGFALVLFLMWAYTALREKIAESKRKNRRSK